LDISQVKDFIQILFWVGAFTLAYLTYRNVNKTLLSPVNTEYQKRVFDSLSRISKELFAELKSGDGNYRLKNPPMAYIWDQMRSQYAQNKESVQKYGIEASDIDMSSEFEKLEGLADEVRFEPFLPKNIRKIVTSYLDDRTAASFDAMELSFNKFMNDLETIDDPSSTLNDEFFDTGINIDLENYYIDRLIELGFSEDNIQNKNREILNLIVEYLESFDPNKK